jgi:hypothetical protein
LTSLISLPIKNLLNQKVISKLFWHKKCFTIGIVLFFEIVDLIGGRSNTGSYLENLAIEAYFKRTMGSCLVNVMKTANEHKNSLVA